MGYRCLMIADVNSGPWAVVMTNSDNGGKLIQEIVKAIADTCQWPDYE